MKTLFRSLFERGPALFGLVVLATFLVAIADIRHYPLRARLFPLTVSLPLAVLATYQFLMDIRKRPRREPAHEPKTRPSQSGPSLTSEGVTLIDHREQLKAMAWLLAFVLGVWGIGFLPTIVLYTFGYIRFEAREPSWLAGLVAILALIFVYGVFVRILNVPLLPGILVRFL